ncbi:hypothetical protein FV220_22690 [Methylobacterium sp. WL19]|nr:hypothetical protein FV220_22690 [Methylobacterium sp. WL19]
MIPLWVVAGLGLVIALGLIAWSPPSQETAWSSQGGVRVWTDPATGCRYTHAGLGMQPLLGPDGRPDCQRRPQ